MAKAAAEPDKVAQCRIEHDGKVYNWGDVVPAAVVDKHPTAVGDMPLTEADISKMTKEELQAQLLKATGISGE